MGSFITENGTFFNRDNWTESLDDKFLRGLDFEAVQAGRSLNFDDNIILSNVLENMQFHTNLQFNICDIQRQFKLAHLRYNTWKGIMDHEAVVYNPNTYSVTASTWTWIELCESYKLASAYHKVSMERIWPELNAIFGPDEARCPNTKAMLPTKPSRAFENIGLDGKRMPTIDELLASYVDEEKRAWERKHMKKGKTEKVIHEYILADVISTTKGNGRVLAPSKEVLVISPEVTRKRIPAEASSRNVRAKCFLSF